MTDLPDEHDESTITAPATPSPTSSSSREGRSYSAKRARSASCAAPDGTLDTRTIDVQAIRAGTEPDMAPSTAGPPPPPDDVMSRAGVAEVDGLVVYPGTYPIVAGETTLRDLVAAAGGLRPMACCGRPTSNAVALLRRQSARQSLEYCPEPDNAAALVEQQIFKQARLADLSFVSRQYLTRELLQYQRVSLELGEDAASIPAVPLRDGDRFVVPRDPGAVLVVGQVRNPGYVPFQASADAAYYIEQAGGQGPAADEVYLREAGSGLPSAPPTNTPIRSGDALFVNRDPTADTEALQALTHPGAAAQISSASARASNRRFQYIQTGLAIVSTAVGIVTTYLLVRDSSSN